jgi:NAD(P)-dependent dehydrogenase (short-subunit alcohol dehydrogenase family)
VDGSLARWGRVDAVVDGAGLGPKGSLLQLADADSQSGKEFYLINVVCIARLATPVVQRRRVRVIVNAFT